MAVLTEKQLDLGKTAPTRTISKRRLVALKRVANSRIKGEKCELRGGVEPWRNARRCYVTREECDAASCFLSLASQNSFW